MAVSRDRTLSDRLPHQLPRGRHGLSRRFVKANQRERIFAAVAETVTSMGYMATAVEDILACAGVSRRTFYDLFGSKEDAFLAAYDDGATRLMEAVEVAYATDEPWRARAQNSMAAFLAALAEAPEVAHLCIVDVLAAGPKAVVRRERTKHRFVRLIEEGREHAPTGRPLPPLAAQTIVGGIYDVVHSHIVCGNTTSLPHLLPELGYIVLMPFIGQEAALDEYELMRSTAAGAGRDAAERGSRQPDDAQGADTRPPCAA